MARSITFKRFVGALFAIVIIANFYWLWTFSSIHVLNPLQIYSTQNSDSQISTESQFIKCTDPLIVTVSNAATFPSLTHLMRSLFETYSKNMKAIVFDIGMNNQQQNEVKSWCNAELVSFPFDNYPKHVKEYENFGWIPAVFEESFRRYEQQCVLFIHPKIQVLSQIQSVIDDLEKDSYWLASASSGSNQITSDVIGIAKGSIAHNSLLKPWLACAHSTNPANKCYGESNSKAGLNKVAFSDFDSALQRIQKQLVIHDDNRYSQGKSEASTILYANPTLKQTPSDSPICQDMAQRKLVIMATNQVPKYSFYMPLSSLVWKSRFQYEGVILLIGREEKWLNHPPSAVVLKYLKLFGVKQIFFVDVPDNLSVFMSQIARIFAAYLPLQADDDTFMLTSDADLWPIMKRLYTITEPGKEMLLLNSMCCGFFDHKEKKYRMFPMGHIGMPRKIWKEVMNVKPENLAKSLPDMIMDEAQLMFNTITVNNVQHGGDGWYNDQNMISIKIQEWSGYPGKAQMEQGFSGSRIDRAWWPGSVKGIVNENTRDAHLLHPGYQTWDRVSPLLQQLVTQEEWELAEQYVKEFQAAVK